MNPERRKKTIAGSSFLPPKNGFGAFLRVFSAVIALCFAAAGHVYAASAYVNEGHTQWTNQRKVISNEYGFWVFFSSNAAQVPDPSGGVNQLAAGTYPSQDTEWGTMCVSYSADGMTWTDPQAVFTDDESSRNGSVWYDPSSRVVYAITGSRIWSGYVYFRKATLNSPGLPSWGSITASSNLDQGGYRNYSTGNENMLANPYVTICKTSGEFLAFTASGGEGDDDDDRTTHTGYCNTSFGGFGAAGQQTGGEIDDTYYYDKAVIVPYGSSNQFYVFSTHGDAAGNQTRSDFNGYYSLNASPGDLGETTINQNQQLGRNIEGHVPSVVVDGGSSYAHIVHPAYTTGILYYKRWTGAAFNTAVDIGDATIDNLNPTIGVVTYADSSKKLVVVYENATGELWKVESDPYSGTTSPTWQTPELWKPLIEETYKHQFPNIEYQATAPNPICVTWCSEDGNVYFDRIPISTNAAPTVNSISPDIAPYDRDQFDVTVNGSDFANWGTGITASYVLATDTNSVANNSQIRISSVTFVSSSQLRLTTVIGNIPTDMGYYKCVITNPDARSSNASTDTFKIYAPVISTLSPYYGGQTSTVTITVGGSNFQVWGSTKPTMNFGSGIAFSSCTYISSSELQATIVIAPSAAGGWRDVSLYNCDGQGSNVLTSSYVVTAPTAAVTFPAEPVDYIGSLSSIEGQAGKNPTSPAGLIESQVLISRTADGFQWSSGFNDFVDPAIYGQQWETASSSSPWSYGGWPTDKQADGVEYSIVARARSDDGGQGVNAPSPAVFLTIDKNPPTTWSTSPSGGQISNNLNMSVAGQGLDAGSGLDYIKVMIADTQNTENTADDMYWEGGAGFTTAVSTYIASPTAPYNDSDDQSETFLFTQFTTPRRPNWQEGVQYRLNTYGNDDIAREAYGTEVKFYFDVTRPTATVTSPILSTDTLNATWVQSFPSISGDINDNIKSPMPNAAWNERTIYMRIYCGDTNKYWSDTQGWVDASTWTIITETGETWSKDTSAITLGNTNKYRVDISAKDKAGNYYGDVLADEDPVITGPAKSFYFQYDQYQPESGILYPIGDDPDTYAYGLDSLNTLSGTSEDGVDESEVAKVEYSLYYAADAHWKMYVTSGAWVDPTPQSEIWNVAGTTTTVPYEMWISSGISWVSGRNYTFTVRSVDNSGRVSTESERQFKYDDSEPESDVIYPAEGYVYNEELDVISGTSRDTPVGSGALPAGVNYVYLGIQRFSNGQWYTSTGWQSTRNDINVGIPTGIDWTWSVPVDFFVTSTDTYKVYVWAKDKVYYPDTTYQNYESSTSLKGTFYYEVIKPTSTILLPDDLTGTFTTHYSKAGTNQGPALLTISGTAWDGPFDEANIDSVLMELIDLGTNNVIGGDDLYWDAGNVEWTSSVVINTYTITGPTPLPWNMTWIDGSHWINSAGRRHRIRSAAIDNSRDKLNTMNGNQEDWASIPAQGNFCYFVIDTSGPAIGVVEPTNGAVTNYLPTISGTAQDYQGFAGQGQLVTSVECAYRNPPETGSYWDGAAFTSGSPVWIPAEYSDGTKQWQIYGSSIPTWSDGQSYKLYVKAKDKPQNITVSTITFTYSTPPPVSRVTLPVIGQPHFQAANLVTISGTCVYSSTVAVRIQDYGPNNSDDSCGGDDLCWDGSQWLTGISTWVPVSYGSGIESDSGEWRYYMPVPDGNWNKNRIYRAVSQSIRGGTVETSYDTIGKTFVIDSTAPLVSLLVPAKDFHNLSSLVSISGTATDSSNPDQPSMATLVFEIIDSDGSYWDGVSTFTATPTQLTATNGGGSLYYYSHADLVSGAIWAGHKDPKNFTVRFVITDKAGNQTIKNKTFAYDNASPNVSLSYPDNQAIHSAVSEVRGDCTDNSSGAGTSAAGIDTVFIRIMENAGTPKYWSHYSNAFVFASTWVPCNVWTDSWTYTNANLSTNLLDDAIYTILVRSYDEAGNLQTTFTVPTSSRTIFCDKTPTGIPTSNVTSPAGNARLNPSPLQIQGTASSDTGGSLAISAPLDSGTGVNVQLKRIDGTGTTYYWQDPGWDTGEYTFNAYFSGASSGTWIYEVLKANLYSDQRYFTRTYAADSAIPANTNSWGSWTEFVLDWTEPDSKPTYPPQDKYCQSTALSTLSGTANGDLSGLEKAEVRISSWNVTFSQWDVSIDWHSAQNGSGLGTMVWFSTYQPTGGWVSGKQYRLESKAYDYTSPQNVQAIVSSVTFTVDDGPATLAIGRPADLSYLNVLHIASGTFNDTVSYVSTVTIAIEKQTAPAGWWNGTNFGAGARQDIIATTSTPNVWSYTAFQNEIADDHIYKFYFKVYDAAENASSDYTRTVTIDTTTPSSAIDFPSGSSYFNAVDVISGTAIDYNTNASRVTQVWIRVVDIAGNQEWNPGKGGGPGWDPLETDPALGYIKVALNAGDASQTGNEWRTPFSWDSSGVTWEDTKQYRVEVKSRDRALKSNDSAYSGNWQPTSTDSIYYIDFTTPSITVTYPVNDQSYNALPTLSGAITEATSGLDSDGAQIIIKGDYGDKYYWSYTASWDWRTQSQLVSAAHWPPWEDATVFTSYPTSWTFTGINWTPGESYEHVMWARITDRAGNYTDVPVSSITAGTGGVRFIYDTTAPRSMVLTPSDNLAFNTGIASLAGTADDFATAFTGSDISIVKIRIRRDFDSQYWGEPGWGASAWHTADDPPPWGGPPIYNWQWTTGRPLAEIWQDNNRYYINSYTEDNATNQEISFTTITVIYDTTRPTSRVQFPPIPGQQFAKAITTISGTANDANTYASKVENVDVAIKRASDGLWWGGWSSPSWGASGTPVFSSATIYEVYASSVYWRYVISSVMWEDTTTYWVISRAEDYATNSEVGWSTNTFICDTTNPQSLVHVPIDDVPGSRPIDILLLSTGSASDFSPGEINTVRIMLYCPDQPADPPPNANNKYWTRASGVVGSAGDWSLTPTWLDTSYNAGTGRWEYNTSGVAWDAKESPGYKYQMWSLAQDKAGNYQTTVTTNTFWYSAPLPVTRITVPAANEYYQAITNLTIYGTANQYTKNAQGGVDLKISSGPTYGTSWNQSTHQWVAGEYWNDTSLTEGDPGSWQIDVSSDAWEDGATYIGQSKGWGPAGFENPVDRTFYIDRTAPAGSVSDPTDDGYYQTITQIAGASNDTAPGQVEQVEVEIKKTIGVDDYYYDGGQWLLNTPTWVQASANTPPFDSSDEPWTYTVTYASECWKTQDEHYIRIRVSDKSTPAKTYNTTAITVHIDTIAPTSDLFYPKAGLYNSIPVISGTAADNSG
ncbi:MAG: IPT/TIG domain-containing protein, partial [Endomicrobiales bacterium]|nr:IPT/TIG domain-containing protein [Endomicrobiales bacterium]